MAHVLQAFLWVHVAAGFVGLVAFWLPILSRKGGSTHVRFGKVFYWSAYAVTLTAMAVAIGRGLSYWLRDLSVAEAADDYAFAALLGYLGLVTFAIVRHGRRVVTTRRAPDALREPLGYALAWASIAGSLAAVWMAVVVWTPSVSPILLGLSPIGLITGRLALRTLRDPTTERAWFFSHLGSMIGGGIAFHTAFAVFGAQSLFDYPFDGPFAIVVWLAPTLVGVPAILIWTAHYRRKFAPAS